MFEIIFLTLQEIHSEVQHEAAHQNPQAGPGGDAEEQHQHRPDPEDRVSEPSEAGDAVLPGGEWTEHDPLILLRSELFGCVTGRVTRVRSYSLISISL